MADYDVTTAAASLEFDTQNGISNSCCQIDETHYLNFWDGPGDTLYAQVFTVNNSTWEVSTANASLSVGTGYYINSCYQIDTNHFINFWGGADLDGFTQVFEVNTATWAVTTAGNPLEFDTQLGKHNECYQVDENHFINFWSGGDGEDGYVQVFTVNTSTWEVTTANVSLEFETDQNSFNSCYPIDTNHFINFFRGVGNDAYAQAFEINTSTWAVTTAGDSLNFDAGLGNSHSCYKVDTNHFIDFWEGDGSDGFVQVFEVDTTTWAITTAAASLEFDTTNCTYNGGCQVDDNHFINFWGGVDSDGFVQVFEVDTSTWAVTTSAAILEFETQSYGHGSCFQVDTNHFINFFQGTDVDGFVQVFNVDVPGAGGGAVAGVIVGIPF